MKLFFNHRVALQLLPTLALAQVLATKYINFQYEMLQEIKFKYFNESLQIGMVNWRDLLEPQIIKLNVEVDEGRLVYRASGSNKRISYKRLKKGLKKRSFSIFEEMPDWFLNTSPHNSPKK